MFIERLKKQFNINTPIFTEEILKIFPEYTRAYIARLLKDSEQKQEILKFSKGVYYIPEKLFFGLSSITADDVIEKKYIKNENGNCGIYSGISLLNKFAITTQVPNILEIVTNNETMRCREKELNGRKFILRKSKIVINDDNKNIYILLQFLNDLGNKTDLNEYSKNIVKDFIVKNRITAEKLVNYANYFPAVVSKNLLRTGVINEAL